MNELKNENVDLIFALDCGTTSFNVFNDHNDKKIDIIVIDHHISEKKFPNAFYTLREKDDFPSKQ